ncbi:MAG: hypothetical protein ACKVS6_02800 [Planctomycetota bacterium]
MRSEPDPIGNDFFGLGFNLLLDLVNSSTLLGFEMPTDAQGLAAGFAPIPNDAGIVGMQVFAQAVFYDPNSPWQKCSRRITGLRRGRVDDKLTKKSCA